MNDPSSLLHLSDLMADVDQPGIGSFAVPGPVLDFSDWEREAPVPAPTLGQDTDQVLSRVLGLGAAALADLRAQSVIGGAA